MCSAGFGRMSLLFALLLSSHISPGTSAAPAVYQSNGDSAKTQKANNDNTGAEKADPRRRPFIGVESCIRCHRDGPIKPSLNGGKSDDWITQTEYATWKEKDRHFQAYSVLLSERSKKMGKLLGVEQIHRDRRCLACHTGFPTEAMAVADDGLVLEKYHTDLKVNFGVSCEGCHGPSGEVVEGDRIILAGWNDEHQKPIERPLNKKNPAWRFLDPQKKSEKYGFWDVRSLVGKAKLCASCHIGNVAQGKILTHGMFAAGHPPLTPFELETFVNQMPPHWTPLSKKHEAVRKEFLENTDDKLFADGAYQIDSLHRTNSMLVAALISLSEQLRVTAALTSSKDKSTNKEVDWCKSPEWLELPSWPALAQFDCFACHHELRSPAWRQARDPPLGVPGRPPLREWTTALVEMALETADAKSLSTYLGDLRSEMSARPFGLEERVHSSTVNAANGLASVAEELQRKSITKPDGVKLRLKIAETAAERLVDYDTARQLSWAFRTVDEELKNSHPSPSEVQTIFEEINQNIILNLRERITEPVNLTEPVDLEKSLPLIDLKKTLPLIANHDAEKFQECFQRIAALLKE